MTTASQLPAVLAAGNASVDDVVGLASLLACCTSVIVAVPDGTIVVTSLAPSLATLISPPPPTVAVLVAVAGADAETLTVSVMAG
jgi:hypothetical protein